MIDWLKSNKGPLLRIALLVAMYIMYRFFPESGPERELLAAIAVVTGALNSALPGFARADTEE